MSTHSDEAEYGLLGESTYEVLSSSQVLTDSEYDTSSSVASLDDHLIDSVSLSGSEADSSHHDPIPIPSFGGLDEHDLDESEITLREDQIMAEEITFEEPVEAEKETVTVSQKIRDFTQAEIKDMWANFKTEQGPPENLSAAISQTMTNNEGLVTDGPLRVLYVGSTAAHDEICKKLGSALMATSSESCSSSWDSVKSQKYSVVPVSSFGLHSRSPEVELVNNSGPEIQLDVCTSAAKSAEDPQKLSIWLNNTHNVVSGVGPKGIELEANGWQLPHLAIIYISQEEDLQAKMTRLFARSFIWRHEIPTLVISQSELYHRMGEVFGVDQTPVHLCVQSKVSNGAEPVVHKRFPIDLSSFLHLNPQQLNRNLACVTKLVGVASDETGKNNIRAAPKEAVSGVKIPTAPGKREGIWKMFLFSWLLMCSIAGGGFAVSYMKHNKTPVPEAMSTFTSALQVTSAAPTTISQAVIPPVPQSTSTSTSSKKAVPSPRPLRAFNPAEEQYNASQFLGMNSTEKFAAYVLGKNYIIVRPPHDFLKYKRAPRLYAEVTREGGQPIPAELSKLFDGVYSLKLNEDDAWGVMNITVKTKTRPVIEETLFVDFGNTWFKLASWMKTIEHSKTGIQEIVDAAKADVQELATEAGQQALGVQQAIVDTMKDLTQEAKDEALWVFKSSADMLNRFRDEYVRTAQKQAKSIWDKSKTPSSN